MQLLDLDVEEAETLFAERCLRRIETSSMDLLLAKLRPRGLDTQRENTIL